jgi:hypothetical protein
MPRRPFRHSREAAVFFVKWFLGILGVPVGIVLDHGVEDHEQLAHASGWIPAFAGMTASRSATRPNIRDSTIRTCLLSSFPLPGAFRTL